MVRVKSPCRFLCCSLFVPRHIEQVHVCLSVGVLVQETVLYKETRCGSLGFKRGCLQQYLDREAGNTAVVVTGAGIMQRTGRCDVQLI